MKKVGTFTLIVLIVGASVLSGCSGEYKVQPMPTETVEANHQTIPATEPQTTTEPEPLPTATVTQKPQEVAKPDNTQTFVSPNEPIKTINWITPAKVEVGNFYAGARAECPLYIHNGNSEETEFTVGIRLPDHNWEGFVDAPLGYEQWVTVEASGVVIAPRETVSVLVVLDIPEGVDISQKNWEFWVVTSEAKGQFIATELACRWLVSMKA